MSDTVLQGQYSDFFAGPLHGSFPEEFPEETDGAGYDSDSDIEDDEQETPAACLSAAVSRTNTGNFVPAKSSVSDTDEPTVR